jgi:hypothetical protein
MVKVGSRWKDIDYNTYIVINVITIAGKDWVYYRKEKASPEQENREFSCYAESFVRRFTPYENY